MLQQAWNRWILYRTSNGWISRFYWLYFLNQRHTENEHCTILTKTHTNAGILSADRLAALVEDHISILQHLHPPTSFLHKGDPWNDAMKHFQIKFNVPNINNVTDNNNRPNNCLVTNVTVSSVIPSVPRVQHSVSRVQRPPPRV